MEILIRCFVFPQIRDSIRDCFVTGAWDKSQDAAQRLKEDGNHCVAVSETCITIYNKIKYYPSFFLFYLVFLFFKHIQLNL